MLFNLNRWLFSPMTGSMSSDSTGSNNNSSSDTVSTLIDSNPPTHIHQQTQDNNNKAHINKDLLFSYVQTIDVLRKQIAQQEQIIGLLTKQLDDIKFMVQKEVEQKVQTHIDNLHLYVQNLELQVKLLEKQNESYRIVIDDLSHKA